MKRIFSTAFLFLMLASNAMSQTSGNWAWGRHSSPTGPLFEAWAVTTDPSGNVIAGGATIGTPTFGNYTPSYTGIQSVIAKYDANGNFLWAQYTYGLLGSWLIDVATDKNSNVYMLGMLLQDSTHIGPFTLLNPYGLSLQTYFIAKLNPSGNVLWAKSDGNVLLYGQVFAPITPSNSSSAFEPFKVGGVVIDSSENVYVSVNFKATSTHVGNVMLSNSTGPKHDFLVAKYDSSGNVIWAKSAHGAETDDVYDMTLTPSGYLYLVGSSNSTSFNIGSTTVVNPASDYMAFVVKMDTAGNVLWSEAAGGANGDFATTVASDENSNIYVAGAMRDNTINFGANAVTNPYANDTAVFLVKFDPSGSVSWSKTIGCPQSGRIYAYSVKTSPCAVWLAGSIFSNEVVGTDTLTSVYNSYNSPMYVTSFTPSGTLTNYMTRAGGGDDALGIACDGMGNLFVCGDYDETGGEMVFGNDTLHTIPGMNEQLFVAKYVPVSANDTVTQKTDTLVCSLANTTLKAQPGYSYYLWNDGSTGNSLSVNQSGTYWVVCTDTSSCAKRAYIDTFIIVKQDINLNFSLGNDTTLCASSLPLHVPLQGLSYLWQDGTTSQNYSVTHSGTYYVTVDDQGCKNADTINVAITNIDISQHLNDTLLCKEKSVELVLTANIPPGGKALWSTGSTQSSITISQVGKYWVTVTDSICSASDTMSLSSEFCDCHYKVPNAFTPNDDGKNDFFMPVIQPSCKISDYTFSIYNRWGQEVFVSKDPNKGWNGFYNGVYADMGVYFWVLKFKAGEKYTEHEEKGDLTLMR